MKILNLFNKNETEERAYDLFLSSNSYMGFNNNDNTKNDYIESIPNLKKGVDLICGLISNLPITLNQETEQSIKTLNNDYRLKFLNHEANFITTSAKFKADMVRDLLLNGKAYAVIEKDKNRIMGLHHVKHVDTKVFVDKNGFPIDQEISYLLYGKQYKKQSNELLIIENPNGGILNTNRRVLNDILDEYQAYKDLLENTALPLGALKTEGRLNDTAIEKLRAAWNSLYTGRKNAGKTIILENGLEYTKLSNDVSLVDLKKSEEVIGSKIENLLCLPKGYLTESSDDGDRSLLYQTINPLVVAIEQGVSKALLLESEKEQGCRFIIDTRELLKTNDSEYQQGVIDLFSKGIITLKQARQKLDLPTDDIKRDIKLLSLGHVIEYQDNNEIFIPNIGASSLEKKEQVLKIK